MQHAQCLHTHHTHKLEIEGLLDGITSRIADGLLLAWSDGLDVGD